MSAGIGQPSLKICSVCAAAASRQHADCKSPQPCVLPQELDPNKVQSSTKRFECSDHQTTVVDRFCPQKISEKSPLGIYLLPAAGNCQTISPFLPNFTIPKYDTSPARCLSHSHKRWQSVLLTRSALTREIRCHSLRHDRCRECSSSTGRQTLHCIA